MNKKKRRHSGWICPQATISKKEIFKNDLFIDMYYDDWEDHRDGFREWYKDFKKIKKIPSKKCYFSELTIKRIRMNAKQKRLLKRRDMKRLQKRLQECKENLRKKKYTSEDLGF